MNTEHIAIIDKRGNPGTEDPVHLKTSKRTPAGITIEPLCNTGQYNIFFTDDKCAVTCSRCIDRMFAIGSSGLVL